MGEIDLISAEKAFANYLKSYDANDPKIRLKIIHTYGVVRCAREIAKREQLSEEDCRLAELIALLHDIGRFEQVTRFNSFEPTVMDHATYGVQILFGVDTVCTGHQPTSIDQPSACGLIRDFIEDNTWDEIIRTAIAHHSDYILPEFEDPKITLHAKIIRDADKLDNCRVKLEEKIPVLLGVEPEEVGSQTISPVIWQTCLDHRAIRSGDRVTKMDYWVSYLAYFYDINFEGTYSIIREEHYVDRIIDRIPYSNQDTIEKMKILRNMLNSL